MVKAKTLGHIPSVVPIIARMKEVGFRISPELEAAVIRFAE
ncbi:MAG: DUF3368 domain-containing protein [Flavobacteriales bacterium]|nr:DUF3368 domain-containing protein [Flavobacteriales bacterium]